MGSGKTGDLLYPVLWFDNINSLDDGHGAVDSSNVVNAPGDQGGLIKICPGLADSDTDLDTPEQKD